MIKKAEHLTNKIAIVNVIILGLGPLILLALLAIRSENLKSLPWFGYGIYLSWAFTINLWVGLGAFFRDSYPGIRTISFTLYNFIIPVIIAIVFIEDLWLVLFEISSYHFTSLGIATGLVMILGPFIEQKGIWEYDSIFKGLYTLKKFKSKKEFFSAFAWMLLGSVIFGITLTLPGIACEYVLINKMGVIFSGDYIQFIKDNTWLIIRYAGMPFEIIFTFKLLFSESIYG